MTAIQIGGHHGSWTSRLGALFKQAPGSEGTPPAKLLTVINDESEFKMAQQHFATNNGSLPGTGPLVKFARLAPSSGDSPNPNQPSLLTLHDMAALLSAPTLQLLMVKI